VYCGTGRRPARPGTPRRGVFSFADLRLPVSTSASARFRGAIDMNAFWTFHDGAWGEGRVPLIGSTSQAVWLASVVFDGARYFDGCAPDLELHAARALDSARRIGLEPTETVDQIVELAREGVRRFPEDRALYIRPMFWG